MNAGKSTVMNAITQQPTSIVDSTPGTTADTKVALMEIHALGPCKLMDTAGINEMGTLGQKKFVKTQSAVKESDLVLLVIDPTDFRLAPFQEITDLASRREKQIAVVFNQFTNKLDLFDQSKNEALKSLEMLTKRKIPNLSVPAINQKEANSKIIPFLSQLVKTQKKVPVLPPKYVGPDKTLYLMTPLDIESPSGRLLRPQTLMIEYALRRLSPVVCYNMDLKQARSPTFEPERQRFLDTIYRNRPSIVVTDSQAIDVISKWTPEEIPLTTFSVAMANFQTNGKLPEFYKGIKALSQLKAGSRVLICEACNHDRIGDDIGTVQLPEKLKKRFPGVEIDWAFGRSYENKVLKDYSLALHCGGCMISQQQMNSRLQDLIETGVPVTNYGLALSWLASPHALERVLKPWQ